MLIYFNKLKNILPIIHLIWEQGVGGSNPLAPTNNFKHLGGNF